MNGDGGTVIVASIYLMELVKKRIEGLLVSLLLLLVGDSNRQLIVIHSGCTTYRRAVVSRAHRVYMYTTYH